ncbi:hypothetical protein MF672_007005 [Actinomadura sp. ATCC 31491]|uniref:Serine/threonine protein kinase n=1 Tax=Actinomadura luzonensis TaxID=2805427 RepID=A0ABT0FMZ2_9ACTN|nr:hypothetical protein [Actinomadura luzonensis]MCK2213543.1 hypothetical protein [Actinomadura luzonensis]
MSNVKRGVTLSLALAATLATSATLSGPAMAASSPIEACGGGSYHVIDSHAFGSSAVTYLLYNGSTNCVVTWKTGAAGNTTYVRAVLWAYGSPGVVDADNYRYYAGPVKAKAPGTCVKWGGTYGSTWWESDWEHCD